MQVLNRHTIEANRLMLIGCDREILQAVLDSEASLAKILNIDIPVKWTEFGEPSFRWALDKIVNEGMNAKWLTYLPVLKEENTLVGTCGFKGAPNGGVVEIGYEVAQDYRCKGLATEMAKALIGFAFQHDEITSVQAHTLAAENESGSVLKKSGMQKVEELEDPEDGKVWRWEVNR